MKGTMIGMIGLGALALTLTACHRTDEALVAITTAPAEVSGEPVNLDSDPHLVVHYAFDETTSKTATDTSGKEHDGTLQGGASFDNDSVEGIAGRALDLQGGEFIEIPGYKGVTGTNPRTVAVWIQTEKRGGEIAVWGRDENGQMWRFLITGAGIYFSPKGGYLYTNQAVYDGEWHHVAIVMQGGERPNLSENVQLYQDGERGEIHDIGLLDLFPIDTGSEMNVMIGRGLEGRMDELRIYDRALTEEEIRELGRK
jgi:hypothetical protein